MKSIIEFITEKQKFLIKGHTKKQAPMEFIDLGLPSGKLWGKYNLGSSSETDPGLFYQWGQITDGAEAFDEKHNFLPHKEYEEWKRKNYSSDYTLKDEDNIVKLTFGDKYQIPSLDDIQELLDNVTIEDNKKDKVILHSKNNDNYLVFPLTTLYQSYGDSWSKDKGIHIQTINRQGSESIFMLAKGYLSDEVKINSNYCRNASNIRPIKVK